MEDNKRPTVLIVGALKLGASTLTELLEDIVRDIKFNVNEVPHFNNLDQHLQDRRPPEIVVFPFADMDGSKIEQYIGLVPEESAVLVLVDGFTEGRIRKLEKVNEVLHKPFKLDDFVLSLLRVLPEHFCKSSI